MYIPYFLHVYRFIYMRYALQPTHIIAYAFLACQFHIVRMHSSGVRSHINCMHLGCVYYSPQNTYTCNHSVLQL